MTSIALSPQRGFCVLPSALKNADIIVATAHDPISWIIREVTASPISHAMLYSGHGRVIEAIKAGVVERSLEEALRGVTLAVAYRYATLTPDQAAIVVTYARSEVGRKYDLGGAIGGGAGANPEGCRIFLGSITPGPAMLRNVVARRACDGAAGGGWQDPNKYYCSELVLASFQKAGIMIANVQPSVSVPQDIVRACDRGTLEYVGHLR